MPKIVSKETRMEKVRASLVEAPSATKVKAWTFQVDKQYYVIVSYFASRKGYMVEVFPSNRKGLKTSVTPLLSLPHSQNYLEGFEAALRMLMPEEFVPADAELSENLA